MYLMESEVYYVKWWDTLSTVSRKLGRFLYQANVILNSLHAALHQDDVMLLRLDSGAYGCETLARIISQKFYFPPHIH